MKTATPTLQRLEDFEKLLSSYRPSDDSLRMLNQTRLVLLVAPTSSGRNTIINQLLKTGLYRDLITDTTRPPRYNDGVLEQDGVEYWFREEDQFYDDLSAGKYLEAAVIHRQQVSGVSLRELEAAHQEGKIAVADLEIVGSQVISSYSPNVMLVFVLPPAFEEWMRRLEKRGIMTEEEKRRRLSSALNEIQTALDNPVFHFVINDNLEETVMQVHKLAQGGVLDEEYTQSARDHAEQVYIEIQTYLSN